jgi:hypothetical protein
MIGNTDRDKLLTVANQVVFEVHDQKPPHFPVIVVNSAGDREHPRGRSSSSTEGRRAENEVLAGQVRDLDRARGAHRKCGRKWTGS